MEHTTEWNDIRGWQRRKQQQQQQQREAEQRRKEQVVQALPPLPLRVIPLPWEDLPSLLCRTARKMGYERPHWLLQPEHIAYSIDPAALPLLHRRTDHLFLQRFLLLEEEQLYRLTLHAFTDRLLCFASIRFRHCQITLPLFEHDWQSLILALRRYSLPEVQFATKKLPKDFSACSEKGRPYLPVKLVLATVFMRQRGKVFWR